MCGVAGIYSLDGTKINGLEFKLKKILKEISHRGNIWNSYALSKTIEVIEDQNKRKI